MQPEDQNEEQQSEEMQDAIIQKESRRVMAETMGVVLDETSVKDFEPSESQESEQDTTKALDAPPPDEPDKPAEPTMEERMQAIMLDNQKLKKALDSTNGRYGSELQQLRQRLDGINNSSNLKKTIAKLSIDQPAFENIKREYPEIGQDLIDGFRLALTGDEVDTPEKVPAEQPPEPVETQSAPPVAHDQTTKKLAKESLEDKHPDFVDIAGFEARQIAQGFNKIEWKNPEFGQWIEAMPDDVREVIVNGGTEEDPSPDTILYIRDVLTEFKKQQAAKPKQAQTPTKPKPDLSRSLVPSGRSQHGKIALSPDDIIENAKRETMKQVMNGY